MNKGRSIRVLATLVVAYGLLSVSCGDPLSPDGSDVSRIDVSPSSIAITVGETRAVTAQAFGNNDERLNGRRIFWASQNATVASVSQSGIITGVGSGNTQIAASAGGKSALVAVSVNARPVSLVRIVPPTPSVQAGRTVTLAAEAVDASGAEVVGRPVSWTSSNPNVASVSNAGVVTGVATGQATITATVDGINGTAVVTVSAVPASSVTIVPDNGSVEQGEALQLSAVARDAQGNTLTGKNATWSSSDEAIATVSSTGRVVGISEGSFTITARIDGVSGTGSYSVTKIPVGVVQVSPQGSTIAVGQTQPMTVSLFAADGTTPLAVTGRTVSWQSSAPSVATVNLNGAVTGVAVGATTITATVEGISGTSTVNVTVVPIASIMLTPDPATVEEGSTLALLATVTGTNGTVLVGRQLTWIVENSPPGIRVAQDGLVSTDVGSAGQTATIRASALGQGVGGGSPTASLPVTVGYSPVSSVSVDEDGLTVTNGQSRQLHATLRNAANQQLDIANRTLSWVGLDATATVTATGLLTGVAPGPARVQVTASSLGQVTGVVGTATLFIANQLPVSTVDLQLTGPTIITTLSSFTGSVKVTDNGGNPLSGRLITFRASDPSIVSFAAPSGISDLAGVVALPAAQGLREGTTWLIAESEGVEDSIQVDVRDAVGTVTVSIGADSVIGTAPTTLTATVESGNGALSGRLVTFSVTPPATVTFAPSASGPTDAMGRYIATASASASGINVSLTASSEGVGSNGVILRLLPAIGNISAAPTSGQVQVGSTVLFVAMATVDGTQPIEGRRLVASSSDSTIAVPSIAANTGPSGDVTVTVSGIAPGNAQITVSGEGKSVVYDVAVVPVPVGTVLITGATIAVGAQIDLTITATDTNGNPAINRTCSVASDNAAVAVLSGSVITGTAGTAVATVRGDSLGSANITATCETESGISVVTVQ